MIKYFDEKGIIEPVQNERLPDGINATTAVTAFSDFLFNELIEKYNAKKVCSVVGGVDRPVYAIERDGKHIVAYKSPVGAPAAAMVMEEVGMLGIKNFIAFGICGALTETPFRTLIVPDKAFRDEGTSYHYLPPADYITLKNSGRVSEFLKGLKVNAVTGGTWCTDGFYRETRTRMEQMKAQGCIAVDMESSALQAVCDFRDKNFYTFFITADSLAGEKWESNDILNLSVTSVDKVAVSAAVEMGFKIS